MKLRPTIFLSGVSSEFRSFRDAVEIEVQKKGCFAENQSSFGVDYRTVEEMLRRRISDSDVVIHVVGFRFGAEPKDRPPNKQRRSYTQMEYDIACELEKPIYLFLSTDASIRDMPDPDEKLEDPELLALQVTHREAIKSNNNLFSSFKDKIELCHLAAEIDAVAQADFREDISRIIKYAPADLVGREEELALLNNAWLKVRRGEPKRPHILTFVALGGEGKTSLVAKWVANLAYENWPGCDSAFAWSFHSQGTREQVAGNSDLFLKEALTFFGDASDREFAASNADALEKGQQLARIVGRRQSILILDGLEPLQYAPTSLAPGELKNSGVAALLNGLVANNDGLCIVTTRYSLPDLRVFWQTTAPEVKLLRLSINAGVNLLKTLGVNGALREFETLVEDVKGHALTLNLLGTYLRDAHGGDIRRRDLVKLDEADIEEHAGHALRVMEAYEEAFENEGKRGSRALAILRLLGLFDGPVSGDCLNALLEKPVIIGLTESLIGLTEAQRNLACKRLEDANLITINRVTPARHPLYSNLPASLDAHPLLREYFAQKLRTQQPESWRLAHERLYKHLCLTTPDKDEPTLEDLQPLYQAVTHGCLAGLHQKACDEVYFARINLQEKFYSTKTLGAFATDLGAVACFFEIPWSRVSPALTEADQAWLLNGASLRLRALGRLAEALEPTRAGVKMYVEQSKWKEAAVNASNLSELELTLGQVTEAVIDAEQSVTYAELSGDGFQRTSMRSTHGDALHQAGRRIEAESRFREAEKMQKKWKPTYPLLYSGNGVSYCDLLLAVAERSVWQQTLEYTAISVPRQRDNKSLHTKVLSSVFKRAVQTLKWAKKNNLQGLIITRDRLTLARTSLYKAMLSETGLLSVPEISKLKVMIDDTVNDLRRASAQEFIVCGLLTRAWMRFLSGKRTGVESAQEDLGEAWAIAERGPMRLHMADIHLYRARLFFREKEYPWESAEADLKAARKLIEQCGYWRRKEELEDAERIILKKSA